MYNVDRNSKPYKYTINDNYKPINNKTTKMQNNAYITATFIQPVLVGETVTKDVAGMEAR